ncbi:glycosyltransferase [Cetobacterium sp. 2G large]|uniref:glycosyltransferase n=1 Tax=Cetobacterium sp. 2G large TaxID=2759680 RepID=UPI00163CE066|nr:glycosyltransferase [Cetobacterium sp. 2G large]MBC2852546.1 glycosyltransferase [Cetobacterium sp. 2G large]
MKKRFVHICEEFEYTWIGKDNGMFPIYAHEVLGYESKIITCNLKNDLPDEVRGIEIVKIPRWFKKVKNFLPFIIHLKRIPLYRYICKNAKDIDILMLFHITKCSYWRAYFYKKFNPAGKVYIKADFNLDDYKKEIARTEMKPKNIREFFRKSRETKEYAKRKKLVQIADLISYETEYAYEVMKDSYAGVSTKGKTMYLANGYDDLLIEQKYKIKKYEEKENIFLTVGRLGTFQKNTEFLLKTLETLDLKDWKFYFVGSIEKDFNKEIDIFFEKYPEKKEKVIFTGEIKDRDILYDYFNRSKVFVLPSRWESFGIVMVEALAFNNYILTSNTAAAEDITNKQEVGQIFSIDKTDELEKMMLEVIGGKIDLKNKEEQILKQKNRFKYSQLIKKIKDIG